MNEITQHLADRIDLVTIHEPKFNYNTLTVMFLLPVVPEKNSAYALALSLLTLSCRRFPDNASMTAALDQLYGATLNSSVSLNGSVEQLMVSGTAIANRYALEGEDLLGELTDLITDCIFAPNAENGAFREEGFRIEQQDLLDAIEAEINNKRGYALMRARRTAFRGEPDAYPLYGTKEDVMQLTPESVYQAYKEILRRAVIRIYLIGPEEHPELAGKLTDAFSRIENRNPEPLVYNAPSPIKPECEHVTEPMDVTQSKLVLAFKAQGLGREQFRLFSAVFGGTPFSLLFANVREKMSLCYYCASRVLAGKDTLIVESGVELDNAEKTHAAILEQLDAIRRGDFSDELVENAKHSIVNAMRSTGDSPFSCLAENYEKFTTQDPADSEERITRYLALTKEDIIAAANALIEDTVYLMQQGGQAE